MKRIFCGFLACLSALLCLASCGAQTQPLADYANENPKPLSLLQVHDGALVNEAGETVILNGVNLGNWMLMETWMSFVPEYT